MPARVQSNGKHLLGLINDVLDLSKIEAGQFVLSMSPYSRADLVPTVVTVVEPLAAEKKLAFRIELPPDLPPCPVRDVRDRAHEAPHVKAWTAIPA